MFNEGPPDDIVSEVIEGGYVEREGEQLKLTDKGNDERNRLSTLAGLNIKYQSERSAMKEKSHPPKPESGIIKKASLAVNQKPS
jgi:hypothetical protein